MNNVEKSIGWADRTINPVKGKCPVVCPYCFARRLYDRFKWNPEVRFDQTTFFKLPMKPSRIFVGSTIELFGDWVKREWLETIFTICRQHSEHTFIFLTKRPEKLIKWSPFPGNCWVGVSADTYDRFINSTFLLGKIEASVKFISFEPLLEQMFISPMYVAHLDWVIIGAQTPYSEKTFPKWVWVKEIIEACDEAHIPYFIKNNLKPMFENNLHQEFPNVK